MYSWGLFFLTIQLFYAYDLLRNKNDKSWIIFTIAAICSSYTHYFCGVSSILIYIAVLIYFILYNKNQIKKSGGRLLDTIDVFDVYENIEEGKKSIAYKLVFKDPNKTLQDDEVMEVFNKIIKEVEEKIGAKLRSN